jgi:hypothetical protein
MNIQYAIETIRAGGYAYRLDWPGITYIFVYGDVIMLSQLGIDSVWVPSHVDLFASDWLEKPYPDR